MSHELQNFLRFLHFLACNHRSTVEDGLDNIMDGFKAMFEKPNGFMKALIFPSIGKE